MSTNMQPRVRLWTGIVVHALQTWITTFTRTLQILKQTDSLLQQNHVEGCKLCPGGEMPWFTRIGRESVFAQQLIKPFGQFGMRRLECIRPLMKMKMTSDKDHFDGLSLFHSDSQESDYSSIPMWLRTGKCNPWNMGLSRQRSWTR